MKADVTYTYFEMDPLVNGRLVPKRALWDQGGNWVIADFLAHSRSSHLIARQALAYGAQFNQVHHRSRILPYVIIEVLAVRPVTLSIFEWAGQRGRYSLLEGYDREQAPQGGRLLQLPSGEEEPAAT